MSDGWRDCGGIWRIREDPGFAGPRTRLRGGRVDDVTRVYEPVPYASTHGIRDSELVVDHDAHAWGFVPGVAGVTAGEILDVTGGDGAAGARLDPAYAVYILNALAPAVLDTRGALSGVSVDNVVVAFDGAVVMRNQLPWWPAPTPPAPRPRASLGLVPLGPEEAALRLFGELLAELLSSKRWPIEGTVFPSLPKKLRRTARRVANALLDETMRVGHAPHELLDLDLDEDYYNYQEGPDRAEVVAGITEMRKCVDVVGAGDVAALARNLFPARWAHEQLVIAELG